MTEDPSLVEDIRKPPAPEERSDRVPTPRSASHLVALALLTAFGAIGATGCGGGASGDAVVQVGHNSISKATVEHWVKVEGVVSQKLIPRSPIPAGLVPDPPAYSACIHYLQQNSPTPAKHGSAGLKRECRQRYQNTRRHVLAILITFQWLMGEGAKRGVSVSMGEARAALNRFKRENHLSNMAFQRYLDYTGQSLADVLLVVKIDALVTKLQQTIAAKLGAAGAAKFFNEFPKRWVGQTSCQAGYVMPDCKQYHGPLPPEVAA
jgi:hypothetical protein